MTLSKAALNVFSRINCPERELISKMFFEKWKNNSVVLDNWFFYQASIEIENNQKYIEDLFNNEYFDLNHQILKICIKWLLQEIHYSTIDGSGYEYIANKIIEFDKSNPIVISRFLKIFSNFRKYKNPYRKNMFKVLNKINESFSPN